MAVIKVDQKKIENPAEAVKLCPFGAIQERDGEVIITSGCRMCMLCVKKGPSGAFTLLKGKEEKADLSFWKDIVVYGEVCKGKLHPVSLELLGKAKELAGKVSERVTVLLVGNNLETSIDLVRQYGPDRIVAYSDPFLENYLIEPYTAVLEDFIVKEMPGIMLFGGTVLGRSLAPRVAARLRTGLTADCTHLDIQKDRNLDQVRPAFGGNIMAHIRTTKTRPQLATVRYKIFNKPEKRENPALLLECKQVEPFMKRSRLEILDITEKKEEVMLEEAETIVAFGNGIKKKEDLDCVLRLAEVLKAQVAGSRPVIEKGWIDQRRQIGLSGRTVRPKLIITCGISGSVQFVAGMQGSEKIVAINSDEKAPIFKIAHHGFVGDLYSLVPGLLGRLDALRRENAVQRN